jgi:hypothetical protein
VQKGLILENEVTQVSVILQPPRYDWLWRTHMNFVIHFNFGGFIGGIAPNSLVYTTAFTESRTPERELTLLLTTESGVQGGTVHALRLSIDTEGETELLPLAEKALKMIRELLVLVGMTWSQGMLLTEGLDGALRQYGKSITRPTLALLREVLVEERANKNK